METHAFTEKGKQRSLIKKYYVVLSIFTKYVLFKTI